MKKDSTVIPDRFVRSVFCWRFLFRQNIPARHFPESGFICRKKLLKAACKKVDRKIRKAQRISFFQNSIESFQRIPKNGFLPAGKFFACFRQRYSCCVCFANINRLNRLQENDKNPNMNIRFRLSWIMAVQIKDSEERMIAKNRKYRCGQPGQEADIPVPTDISV